MRKLLALLLAAVGVSFVSGCGGGGSSEPASEVLLSGKILAAPAQAQAGGTTAKAAGDPILVSVQENPSIRTTVGEDGTFTLRGLPAGSFTLVFVQGGEIIGTMEFTEVAINQQITITIQVVGGEAILVDEDRRGIGHAGIEIEGLVDNVIVVSLTGDSKFVIAGRTVIARPGVTAIRKGTTRLTVEDVTAGKRVHVKGTAVADSTDVLAYEIKIQEETPPGGGPAAEEKITICHAPPGKPDKKQTITIGISAWPAHEAHGDKKGPC